MRKIGDLPPVCEVRKDTLVETEPICAPCRQVITNAVSQFKSGRADCTEEILSSDKPYATTKKEAHPNAVGDGRDTVAFFKEQFGMSGRETVALMGAHTIGTPKMSQTLFPYTWTAYGTELFNNHYYK